MVSKKTATSEVAKVAESQVPAFLGEKRAKLGNVDNTDMIIPRVKLLQLISPEVESFGTAKPGLFWHTVLEEPMGSELLAVPIVIRKSIVLWAPRNDERGVLARSSDGVMWDRGYENLTFEVKHKGMAQPVRYFTGESVKASGLAEFGSMIPGDPNSPPAASLTYNIMFWFPEYAEMGPAVIINTRSAVRAAKSLISKIELRNVDHYGQVFRIGVTDEQSSEGPYKGYSYTAAGYVTEEQYNITKKLYETFGNAEWRANEEVDEGGGHSGASSGDTSTTKF